MIIAMMAAPLLFYSVPDVPSCPNDKCAMYRIDWEVSVAPQALHDEIGREGAEAELLMHRDPKGFCAVASLSVTLASSEQHYSEKVPDRFSINGFALVCPRDGSKPHWVKP